MVWRLGNRMTATIVNKFAGMISMTITASMAKVTTNAGVKAS